MKIIRTALAIVGAAALAGMGAGAAKSAGLWNEDCEKYIQAAESYVRGAVNVIENVNNAQLSTEKHGYGQGVIVDGENCPVGATDFNAAYSQYGAYALKDTDEKVIYLTFDQGYENGYTAKILDVLKEKGVKATFFVVGDYAKRNEELVKRMIDEGHAVGNHTMSHYSMPDLSQSECAEEINSLHEYVKEHYGYEMNLLRPPMGEFSEASLKYTADCGYETVLWSFAYADWDVNAQPDPAQAEEKIVSAAHCGAIYLLHSVSQTNAEILGDVIDRLTEQGYTFRELEVRC